MLRLAPRYLEMPHATRLLAPPSPPLGSLAGRLSKLLYLREPSNFLVHSVESVSVNSLRGNGFHAFSQVRPFELPMIEVDVKGVDEAEGHYVELERKLETLGLNFDSCMPGHYDLLHCPKCQGGPSTLRTLSFHISQDRSYAMWRCFHLPCGWADKVFSDDKEPYPGEKRGGKLLSPGVKAYESEKLEPLGEELITYFAERKISKETLQRNNVMQIDGDQKIIAFTYRRNGMLVGCKYRTVEKKFWQARNAEKILYGLDDIVNANEIIIVEGELDKLSVEEAGYRNCVSVPDGAPQTVSLKELPPVEKDTRFQYLWNCIEYFEKASRIILATDGDTPGQALAEELARRLGKERCLLVRWPKKDEMNSFKDANEVLQSLGPVALREAIDRAALYQTNEALTCGYKS